MVVARHLPRITGLSLSNPILLDPVGQWLSSAALMNTDLRSKRAERFEAAGDADLPEVSCLG